jgi:hypothetical protein
MQLVAEAERQLGMARGTAGKKGQRDLETETGREVRRGRERDRRKRKNGNGNLSCGNQCRWVKSMCGKPFRRKQAWRFWKWMLYKNKKEAGNIPKGRKIFYTWMIPPSCSRRLNIDAFMYGKKLGEEEE